MRLKTANSASSANSNLHYLALLLVAAIFGVALILLTEPDLLRSGLAAYPRASGPEIGDAFADAVTRIIDDVGTDPCCEPQSCRDNPF